jgi:MoxR-like ATPase
MSADIKELNEQIKKESEYIDLLTGEIGKVIVGQKYMIERLLIGLLSDGHVLLEGLPGLAKTLAIKSLSDAVQTSFSRVQFTPDLLPADLIGTLIYNEKKAEFTTKKGPIFTNFLLADEINRSPAKVQSALLEAMAESQVTIGSETFPMEDPFLVLATQNPIEQEGTYPLPEAQVDRFMLKLKIGYPSKEDELEVLRRQTRGEKYAIQPVVTIDQIRKSRELVKSVYMDEKIEKYIVDIVFATREPSEYGLPEIGDLIAVGGSPRATISLAKAAKAHAFLRHRGYVTPEDVKSVALDVLRHRIIVTFEAEAEEITSEDIVKKVLNRVEVP